MSRADIRPAPTALRARPRSLPALLRRRRAPRLAPDPPIAPPTGRLVHVPGRGESLEQYVKRLRDLEHIATRHDGVDKVYAMQAGREIRVMVQPGALDDDGAVLLSHEIAREIEQELEYPGQIKVTVIRESRATDYAR